MTTAKYDVTSDLVARTFSKHRDVFLFRVQGRRGHDSQERGAIHGATGIQREVSLSAVFIFTSGPLTEFLGSQRHKDSPPPHLFYLGGGGGSPVSFVFGPHLLQSLTSKRANYSFFYAFFFFWGGEGGDLQFFLSALALIPSSLSLSFSLSLSLSLQRFYMSMSFNLALDYNGCSQLCTRCADVR